MKGFALDWNRDLTLIHALNWDFFRLNGYAILRNSDVRRWRSFSKDDFIARAVRRQKVRPSMPDKVKISSMREAVRSAGTTFPLITIHREPMKRGVCYVGRFLRTNQRATTIQSISPHAEWEEEERYSLGEITLLEFGGEYEALLHKMSRQ